MIAQFSILNSPFAVNIKEYLATNDIYYMNNVAQSMHIFFSRKLMVMSSFQAGGPEDGNGTRRADQEMKTGPSGRSWK